MKTMTVSLLLVSALAAALFLLVWYLTDDAKAAREAATFVIPALPIVSSWLEQAEAKQSSDPGKRMAIRSFEGFSISLPVAVAVGTIVGVAIVNIGSFFSGFAVGVMRPQAVSQAQEIAERAKALAGANFASIPIFLVGFYLLGRWLSRRSRNALSAVFLTALLTAIIVRSVDFSVASPEEWKGFYQFEKAFLSLSGVILIQFAVILIISLVGFWRGRGERKSQYMGYLLSALPEDTQNSLVDLAFGEVKGIVEVRRSRSQHSTS